MSHGKKPELDSAADLAERLLAEDEKELKRAQSTSVTPPSPSSERSRKKAASIPRPGGKRTVARVHRRRLLGLRTWASLILAAAGRMDAGNRTGGGRLRGVFINASEETSLTRPTRVTEMMKHHVPTEVGPNPDEQLMAKALTEADASHLDDALRVANLSRRPDTGLAPGPAL